ncbi:hypothetical protein DB346_04720 [Verrucomicrobia bacterium LW23]|nr:hypothetical protein DB346_04720 [Verrucomicrobia bacterium LW23]
MLVLGLAVLYVLGPVAPPLPPEPLKVVATNEIKSTNQPPRPPFHAPAIAIDSARFATTPPPAPVAATNAPPRPPEKVDPDEEAVTKRFPNPLPAAAPVLRFEEFASAEVGKGKLVPPALGSLQKRIPLHIGRKGGSDSSATPPPPGHPGGATNAPPVGAAAPTIRLTLVKLTRDEALIQAGAVDALEAYYLDSDTEAASMYQIRPPAPRLRIKPSGATPGATNAAATNAPPLPAPTNAAPVPAPAVPGVDPATPGADKSSALTALMNRVSRSGRVGPVRYRLLEMPDASAAQNMLQLWLSRFGGARPRTESFPLPDKSVITAYIFEASPSTMGWGVVLWTNGTTANSLLIRGSTVSPRDVFLLLPY